MKLINIGCGLSFHNMYARFSLRRLLEKSGFTNAHVCRVDESSIPDLIIIT